jgi:hypothetical protein
MPDPQFGRFKYPGSLRQLTNGRGWNSPLTGFLLPLAMRDFIFLSYDFENATISPDWAVSNSGGTSAADFASTDAVEGGILRGDTGTDDNGSLEIHFGKTMFDAARNPGMEMGLAFDVVTSMAFEIAFADPPSTASTLNVASMSAVGVPTITSNGVTDQFGIVRNTDYTLTTAGLYSKGTTDAVSGALLGTFAPTAATYHVYRIQGGDGNAYGIIDDNENQAAGLILGPDTGILMRPHLIVATKVASTAKFPDLDYARIWAERNY